MPITILKEAAETEEAVVELDVFALVDAYGEAEQQADKIRVKILKKTQPLATELKEVETQMAYLQQQIIMNFEEKEHGDARSGELQGAKYRACIGAKAIKRTIKDMELAKKYLSPDVFMKLVKLTLKDVDDYLTPPQKEQVLNVERSGNRSFSVKPALKVG